MKTAYAAGRYGQLQRMKKLFPFWRYRIGNSRKHRPEHEAWDGLVLSADDKWWDTHYPPNGWGCNCYVQALDEVDLRELGKKGPDPAPEGGSRRVQHGNRLIDVPNGIDAGWAYAPGKSGYEAQMNVLAKADPHVAAQAWEKVGDAAIRQEQPALDKWVAEIDKALDKTLQSLSQKEPEGKTIADLARAADQLDEDEFAAWVQEQFDTKRLSSQARPIGFLPPRLFERLEAKNPNMKTSVLEIRGEQLLHLRIKRKKDKRVSVDEIKSLMQILKNPERILFDKRDGKLLFVMKQADEAKRAKFVVKVGTRMQVMEHGQRVVRFMNLVESAGIVDERILNDTNFYEDTKDWL
jgi:hypothetical protein